LIKFSTIQFQDSWPIEKEQDKAGGVGVANLNGKTHITTVSIVLCEISEDL